jgi:hypothetical protein
MPSAKWNKLVSTEMPILIYKALSEPSFWNVHDAFQSHINLIIFIFIVMTPSLTVFQIQSQFQIWEHDNIFCRNPLLDISTDKQSFLKIRHTFHASFVNIFASLSIKVNCFIQRVIWKQYRHP